MESPKTKTITSSQPADQLFAAVQAAVQNGKYEVTSVDEAQHRIDFTSGKTGLSWGNEYVATVSPTGDGATLEVVCGTVAGAPKALLDGWKNGKAADKFLQTVQA